MLATIRDIERMIDALVGNNDDNLRVHVTEHDVPTDIYLDGDSLNIALAVPGFSEDELNVTLDEKGFLRISGKRKTREDVVYKKREIYPTEFKVTYYSVSPDKFDLDNIRSIYKNGILTVKIPLKRKNKDEDIKQIPIQTGED